MPFPTFTGRRERFSGAVGKEGGDNRKRHPAGDAVFNCVDTHKAYSVGDLFDMHLALGHLEFDRAFGEGVQREVAPLADVLAGVDLVALLPHDDGSGDDRLAAEAELTAAIVPRGDF